MHLPATASQGNSYVPRAKNRTPRGMRVVPLQDTDAGTFVQEQSALENAIEDPVDGGA